jgi:ankyrin repeat protein
MNRKKRQRDRAFLDAIHMCNKDEVRRLLKDGANVEAREAEHGETAIILAAKFCDRELIEMLINEGAKVNEHDDQGRSALFFADVGSEIFAVLVAAGADIHAVDHVGNTLLMRKVSQSPSLDEVEALLMLGVNPHIRNLEGESALDLAVELGLTNVIARLRSQSEG